jgi:hypothetical protein
MVPVALHDPGVGIDEGEWVGADGVAAGGVGDTLEGGLLDNAGELAVQADTIKAAATLIAVAVRVAPNLTVAP